MKKIMGMYTNIGSLEVLFINGGGEETSKFFSVTKNGEDVFLPVNGTSTTRVVEVQQEEDYIFSSDDFFVNPEIETALAGAVVSQCEDCPGQR